MDIEKRKKWMRIMAWVIVTAMVVTSLGFVMLF